MEGNWLKNSDLIEKLPKIWSWISGPANLAFMSWLDRLDRISVCREKTIFIFELFLAECIRTICVFAVVASTSLCSRRTNERMESTPLWLLPYFDYSGNLNLCQYLWPDYKLEQTSESNHSLVQWWLLWTGAIKAGRQAQSRRLTCAVGHRVRPLSVRIASYFKLSN